LGFRANIGLKRVKTAIPMTAATITLSHHMGAS
jgi:hypothetical protein